MSEKRHESHWRLLSDATPVVSAAIHSGGLHMRRLQEMLLELGYALSSVRTPREGAMLILHAADQLFGWDACAVDLAEEDMISYSVVTIDTIDNVRQEVPTRYHEITPGSMYHKTLSEGPQLILRQPQTQDTSASILRPFGNANQLSMSLMFVPIRRGRENTGLLTIQSYTADQYDREDLMLLQVLADYCSGTLARTLAELRLREREEHLRLLTEQIPAVLWTTDEELKLTACLGAGLKALGMKASEWEGRSAGEFFQARSEAAESVRMHWRALRGEPVSRDMSWGDRYHRIYVEPLHDTDGSTIGCIGVAYDITGQKNAERARERTLAELERSNADLEAFAYVASHDLQEPLRMVASYVQLLKRRYVGQLDQDANEFIEFAVDGANRMQALISDLLAYSRAGRRGRKFAPVDLNQTFERAVSNLRLSIEESGALVEHEDLPTVMADEAQMLQLFQNLIGNGIKFHRPGVAPQLHVGVRDDPEEWILSFRDNGLGIPEEFHERVFVIFQRMQTREEYAGTGIGLALCKKIVERHHGRVWLESQPGEGTEFFVTLLKRESPDDGA